MTLTMIVSILLVILAAVLALAHIARLCICCCHQHSREDANKMLCW